MSSTRRRSSLSAVGGSAALADISDVEIALVNLISATIYPNGTSNPSATGYDTRVFPGWPLPDSLDVDVAAGKLNISVFPEATERVTTRFPREWTDQFRGVPTITVAVTTQTVTLGGAVTVGQYVSIIVHNKAVSYATVLGDTLTSMAVALTTLLVTAGLSGATSSGPVITIPNATAADIVARVGAPGTVIREVRRQQRSIRISIWAPDHTSRIATANLIDPILAATDWLFFPDGSPGWLLYQRSMDVDEYENREVFRRDLCYFVEYATTQVMPGYPITINADQINSPDGTTQGSTYTANS